MVLKSEFSMFSSFCRLCATTSELLIPVFGKEGDRERVGWKIRKCLPILVEQDDEKPKQVCLTCISKLDVCYELIELSLAADAKFDSFLQSSNTVQDVLPEDGQTLQEPQDGKSLQEESNSDQMFSNVSSLPQEQKPTVISVSSQQAVSGNVKEHTPEMAPTDTSQALTWPVDATAAGLIRQDGSALALSPEGSVIVLGKMQQDGVARDDCQDILLMVELKYNKDTAMPEIQAQQVIPQIQPQPIKARIINYVPDSDEQSASLNSTGLSSADHSHSVGTSTGAYVHETFVTEDNQNVRIAYSTSNSISKTETLTFITEGDHLATNSQAVPQVSFANTNVTPTLTKEGTLSFVTTTAVVAPDSHIISFTPGSDISPTPIEDYSEDCPTPKMEFIDTANNVDPKLTELVYESDSISAEQPKQPADDSQKPFACSVCGKRFMRRTNLRTHLAVHTTERPHTCETCGKSFAVRWDLTLHRRLHTGVYTCEICGKAFSVRGKLERHRRVHSGERPFSCSQCGKAFSDKHNLEAHIRTHSDVRPFSCQQCGHTFRSRSHLRAHRRVHSPDAPFVCHLCGKPFKWKANLNLHIKVHSGERFKCECCGREFSRPGDLVRHRRGHEGVRPHTCTVCSKSYTDRAALNKHMKSHAEHRPFVCDVCNKSFHFQWYLNTHKKMHETQGNRKYICSTCGKEFPKRISLIGHEKFHLAEQRSQSSEILPEVPPEVPPEAVPVVEDSPQPSAVPIESSDI